MIFRTAPTDTAARSRYQPAQVLQPPVRPARSRVRHHPPERGVDLYEPSVQGAQRHPDRGELEEDLEEVLRRPVPRRGDGPRCRLPSLHGPHPRPGRRPLRSTSSYDIGVGIVTARHGLEALG